MVFCGSSCRDPSKDLNNEISILVPHLPGKILNFNQVKINEMLYFVSVKIPQDNDTQNPTYDRKPLTEELVFINKDGSFQFPKMKLVLPFACKDLNCFIDITFVISFTHERHPTGFVIREKLFSLVNNKEINKSIINEMNKLGSFNMSLSIDKKGIPFYRLY